MADLRDFTGKNRKFTGAAGIKTSDDGLGTGDRVNEKGRIRFNDTTDLLEYYNGTDWKAIDAPPVITGFTIDNIGGTAVARDLFEVLKSSETAKELMKDNYFKINLTKNFILKIQTVK